MTAKMQIAKLVGQGRSLLAAEQPSEERHEKNSEIVVQLPRCGKVLANPNPHFVCILRMAASVCQLVPDAFVRFPSSERSSVKSPFRQVNAA